MIFRNLTPKTAAVAENARDWTLGSGQQDFLTGVKAISLATEMALQIFLGEVFWDLNAGVDWWNLCGSIGAEKAKAQIVLQCRKVILGVSGVESINSVEAIVNNRQLTITFNIETTYGTARGSTSIVS